MDSTIAYSAVVDAMIDYSGVWKVSSETCTIDGTNTEIGSDPTESVPTITTGVCSDDTEVMFLLQV